MEWQLAVIGNPGKSRGYITFPADAVGLTYPIYNEFVPSPPLTVAAGAVATFTQWGTISVDTTNDLWYMSVTLLVTDSVGVNQLVVDGSMSVPVSGPGASGVLLPADLSVLTSTGVDLSYDAVTGIVSSAGGGVYAVVMELGAGWD